MKYYMLVEIDMRDTAWTKDYLKTVTPMVEAYGGVYLSRTAAHEQVEGEGERRQIVSLVEWPSRGAALAFYNAEEYRPFRESRIAQTRTDITLIPAEDMNKRQ